MRILLLCALLAPLFFANSAEKDEEIYLVVSAVYNPGIAKALRSKESNSKVICYPVTYRKSEYSEEVVKQAFKEFLMNNDDEGRVFDLQCSSYEDRSEAIKHYKEATTSKENRFRRVTFSRAHIEKVKRKLGLDKEEEKPAPVTQPVKVPARNIDDIYD